MNLIVGNNINTIGKTTNKSSMKNNFFQKLLQVNVKIILICSLKCIIKFKILNKQLFFGQFKLKITLSKKIL